MATYPGLPAPALETLSDYGASREQYRDQAALFIANYHLSSS